jgi:AAA family ATP:ADP antiporter
MLHLLHRLLGMNHRELRRSLPLFAYLFLTMAGSVASKAARDALFLERFRPEDLPFADIAIAGIVGVVASLYIRAGERLNLRNLQVVSLLVFAVSALGFWSWSTVPERESPTLFMLIYIWVGVLSVLAPAQVWTLANFVLTTREAKRTFGLIGSGAILGWIVGGLGTRLAVGQFGTEIMLLLTAVSQIVCIALVLQIWHRRPASVRGEGPAGADRHGGLLTALQIIGGSKYLKAIASVILLSSLATTVEAWQFKAIAKSAIPDTDALTMFFGTFNMVAGVVSLALQLLVTGRALRRGGVGLTLFIVPVALTVTSVGVLVTGTLVAATLLRASDQVLRYSVDKATVELLYLPVPASQTFVVKSFIDTAVYRMGDGLGGLVVLVFATALGWSPVKMAWICLVLLGGWMAAAVVARREYVENLQDSIHQHRLDAERDNAPVLERAATEMLTARLGGDTHEIVYALSLFELAHDRAIHPAVRGLLKHPVPEVRRRALALLSRADDLSVKDQVQHMLHDPDLEVRTEALLYLTEHANVDPLESIQSVGDFEDFSIRASMVAFLARPGRAQNVEAARLMLGKMAEEAGAAGQRTRLEAARLIGFLPDLFDRELRELLQDVEVAKASMRAASQLNKRIFVGRIIERMQEPALAPTAVDALAAFGDRIVGTLRDTLVDPEMPADVRREIPAVLQEIGSRAAQAVLTESVLDKDVVLRYRCIAALNKLGQLHPDRPVDRKIIESVLGAEILGHYRSYQVMGTLAGSLADSAEPVRQGLHESMEKETERIFRLLKMLYPEHDLHSAYVGLQSSDPMVHDNALEFIDTILPPEIRAVLMPIIDRDVSIRERIQRANQLLGSTLGGREEAVEVLTQSADPWLRSCAAYTIGELHLHRFVPVLEEWSRDQDPLLRAAALEALQKLKDAATITSGDSVI